MITSHITAFIASHTAPTPRHPAARIRGCTLIGLACILALSGCQSLAPQYPASNQNAAQLIHNAPTSAGRAERIACRLAEDHPNSTPPTSLRLPGSMSLATAQPVDLQLQDDAAPQTAIGAPTDELEPDAAITLGDKTAHTDLWARVRQGFAFNDLNTDLVQQHEQWYARRPEYVSRMTERSSRYLYHVMAEIERRNMPAELALLPFIESAFNPRAMSAAKASGMWQFVPATGKDYDLKQNIFRDDRRDVLASTRAALDYLHRLHNMFGDWHLALAAYNWGEGNVQRAIARNRRAGLPTDYASLNMPLETRHYVPKLQAVKNIIAQPEAFGLSLAPVANHPYFVSVPIKRDIDVALVCKLSGLSLDEFHALNPSLNKPVILANGTSQLLLPYDNAERFASELPNHRGPLATWTAWVVPKTMRPAEAAHKVGMNENQLRDINRIPPKMLVKGGSTLLVHRSPQRTQDISEELADNAVMSLTPDVPPLRKIVVRAGKRDSLASLARRYRVSSAQLANWNKLSARANLKAGQQVVVYVPGKSRHRSTTLLASAKTSPKAKRLAAAKSSSRQKANSRGRSASRTVATASSNTTRTR